ncbi:MAG TPA: carboxypeptidase-like regulatory domain-containing protein [Gemmatirosa sp.]|nr:carboxypeptidase-like regulatory domain-containing protein [Gemmatirosa sp.]
MPSPSHPLRPAPRPRAARLRVTRRVTRLATRLATRLVTRLATRAVTLALLGAAVRPAGAQTAPPPASSSAPGAVQGLAVRAEDGTAVPFALVRLVRADGPTSGTPSGAPSGTPAVVQQVVTSASGRFHLAEVPTGAYRLQLARIGHQPVLSPVLRVEAGQTLRHDLRAETRVLQLAAITVRPEAGCLTIARLGDDERLATLWQEARKSIETRLAFERQYRFTRVTRQDGAVRFRIGARGVHTVDTTRSEPDSVEVRRLRRIAERRARGFKAASGGLQLPNEKDLLDEEYMREQCLDYVDASSDTTAARLGDVVGLRFRPVRPRSDVIDLDGTLWLDARTFLTRRLDVRWIRGDAPFARATMQYDDVPVIGSTLRLPVGATAVLQPSALTARAIVRGASSQLVIRYLDFASVAAR